MAAQMVAAWGLLSDTERPDAAQLAAEGRILAMKTRDGVRYPTWQFAEDGTPRPVVREVLAMLHEAQMSERGQAFWWFANSAWLPNEARPYELVASDPERVVAAARKLREPEPL